MPLPSFELLDWGSGVEGGHHPWDDNLDPSGLESSRKIGQSLLDAGFVNNFAAGLSKQQLG